MFSSPFRSLALNWKKYPCFFRQWPTWWWGRASFGDWTSTYYRLANLKREHQQEEFASNAVIPDVKLKISFSCNCKYFNAEKCSSFFKEGELLSLRMSHLEMDNTVLDMVVLVQIQSHLHSGEETTKSKKGSQTFVNRIYEIIKYFASRQF